MRKMDVVRGVWGGVWWSILISDVWYSVVFWGMLYLTVSCFMCVLSCGVLSLCI